MKKKFNLDGPDNWKSWTEEKSKILLNKRQCGGGSIMVWGMLFPAGQIFVKKMTGRVNSEAYIKMLKEYAIPVIRDILGEDFIVQQDNCSVHVSKRHLIFSMNMA